MVSAMKNLFITLSVLLVCIAPAAAKNIDLSTVPVRQSVQLTIYNSEDLTLVRETRKITFKKGVNGLQFSWANTLIDPSSVELRFLTHPDRLSLLDTTFPHDKPHMLYWNVQSEFDGEAMVEITYFTSGISWQADYVCIADAPEQEMSFEGFVRVYNRSGEEYEDAEVRLIVGKINLVEKIAQLARIPISQAEKMQDDDGRRFADLRLQAGRKAFDAAARPGEGAEPATEKTIVKEGLSEYFMYSIEGTETIPDGWSKRMRSFEGKQVPFRIQYRYRPREYGDQLVRMYLLTNDTDSDLGTTPLPDGMARVFRQTGREGLSFLTAQQIKYVPIGDKIELNLGADPDVVFELVTERTFRDEIWVHWNRGRIVQRVGDGAVQIDVNADVIGWDQHHIYNQRIRNYTAKKIDVEVRRAYGGHAIIRGRMDGLTNHDYRTMQYTSTLEPGQKKDHRYELIVRHGYRSKQNNLTVEVDDPAER
jgi:hypothetical protein